MDCSLPGPSVCGVFQARILEWFAMPSSRGSSQPRDRTSISSGSCTAGRFFTTKPRGKPTAFLLVFKYTLQESKLIFCIDLFLEFIKHHHYKPLSDHCAPQRRALKPCGKHVGRTLGYRPQSQPTLCILTSRYATHQLIIIL